MFIRLHSDYSVIRHQLKGKALLPTPHTALVCYLGNKSPRPLI